MAGGRAGGNFARASSSQSMLSPHPSLSPPLPRACFPFCLPSECPLCEAGARPRLCPRDFLSTATQVGAAGCQAAATEKSPLPWGTVTSTRIMLAPLESRSPQGRAPGYPHFSGRHGSRSMGNRTLLPAGPWWGGTKSLPHCSEGWPPTPR